MIYAMLNIDATKESIIIVVIEPENLRRMDRADPISIESANRGGLMKVPKYPEALSLLIAYERDDELYRLVRDGDLVELLRWLERGRQFIRGLDGKENSFKIPMR
jgi:hypothetical protein